MKSNFFIRIGITLSSLCFIISGISGFYYYQNIKKLLIKQKEQELKELSYLYKNIFTDTEKATIKNLNSKLSVILTSEQIKEVSQKKILSISIDKSFPKAYSHEEYKIFLDALKKLNNQSYSIEKQSYSIDLILPIQFLSSGMLFQKIPGIDSYIRELIIPPIPLDNLYKLLENHDVVLFRIQNNFKLHSFIPIEDEKKQLAGIIYLIYNFEDIFLELESIYNNTIEFVLFSLIASIMVSYILAYKLSMPISQITRQAKRIVTNNIQFNEENFSVDEFNLITKAFNSVGIEIQHYHTENEMKKKELENKNSMLIQQNEVLFNITKSDFVDNGDIPSLSKLITEAVQKVLDVERVSIWLYDSIQRKIYCIDCFTIPNFLHSSGDEIYQKDHPIYFSNLENSRVISVKDVYTDPKTAEFVENYSKLLGICSLLDAIIRRGNVVNGVICIESTSKYRDWTLEEINFVGSIAEVFSLALSNHQERLAREELKKLNESLEQTVQQRTKELNSSLYQIQKDILTAKKIHDKLLPRKDQKFKGIDFCFEYIPLESIGGDLFDITHIGYDLIRFMMCDVIGHGIQASFISIVIKSEYEDLKYLYSDPASLIKELNFRLFAKYKALTTYFPCIVIDMRILDHKINYASAGHPEQLLIHKNGSYKWLEPTSYIIGMTQMMHITNNTTDFNPGDRLILFSDGITESFNENNEMFGEERLLTIAKNNSDKKISDVISIIVDEEIKFRNTEPKKDDITVIGIELC